MNDFLSKKDLLEHYSNDDALTTLSQRSEKEKDELLLAL